jgi:glucose/arabinose dehydrogenase
LPFIACLARGLLRLEQNFEERGLGGFALHPQFARNGRVFATYSAPLRPTAPERWNHTRRVSAFSADPGNLAKIDAASAPVLLQIDWPSRKHNGAALAFGPDGFLYIGLRRRPIAWHRQDGSLGGLRSSGASTDLGRSRTRH